MYRLHKNGSTAPGTSKASYNLTGKSSGSCEACQITRKKQEIRALIEGLRLQIQTFVIQQKV